MRRRGLRSTVYETYYTARRWVDRVRTPLPAAPGPLEPVNVRKALLVCTGLLGDSVMCLPAIKAGRELLPNAEIIGLVNESARGVLALTACFDRFIMVDGAPLRLRRDKRREVRALEKQLAAENISLAVIFLGDDYAPLITRAAIPHRVFVAESPHAELATATYAIGHARTWGPPERLRAWTCLGLDPAAGFPPLRPASEAMDAVKDRLGVLPRPWVVLHPFGRTHEQWWPMAAAEDAARKLCDRLGATVIFVGGRPGEPLSHSTDDRVVDLVAKLTLDELVAVIALSDTVITTDSGPFHLAGALGRRGVGLFRASRPEHAARYPSMAGLIAPALAQCQGECSWDRCATNPCRQMEALGAERVVEAAASALARP